MKNIMNKIVLSVRGSEWKFKAFETGEHLVDNWKLCRRGKGED